MSIKYQINKDAGTLALTADDAARKEIRELIESELHCGWRWMEVEALDCLTSSSELQWIDPVDTGDLTDAPMLGITGGEEEETREKKGPFGAVCVGGDGKGPIFSPILERWGFMQYETRSFLEDLMNEGKAVFTNRN